MARIHIFRIRKLGIVVLPLILAGAYLIATRSPREDWRQLRPDVDLKLKELANRPARRPVLWGTPAKGYAFDWYSKVTPKILEIATANRELIEKLSRRIYPHQRMDDASEPYGLSNLSDVFWFWTSPEALSPRLPLSVVEDDILGLAGLFQPALDLVREGARCEKARRDSTFDPERPYILEGTAIPIRVIGMIQHVQIYKSMRAGESSEALHVLLDGLQMGRDLLDDPDREVAMQGALIHRSLIAGTLIRRLGEPIDGAPESERLTEVIKALSSEDLKTLRDAILQLSRRPTSLRLGAAFAYTHLFQLLDADRYSPEVDSLLDLHHIFRGLDDIVDSLPQEDPRSWTRMKQIMRDAEQRVWELSGDDEAYGPIAPDIRSSVIIRFTAVTKLRLVQLFLLLDADRKARVEDPFGKYLLTEQRNGKTLFWSVDADGVDHRGDPDEDLVLWH